MKTLLIGIVFSIILVANESDWDNDNSWGTINNIEEKGSNDAFEKAKIENRANREYSDKVYKYITGDYLVENNTIELATVRLKDNLQQKDVEVNMYVENLDVEGNAYKDGLDIRRNRYKNFVNHDAHYLDSFEDLVQEDVDSAYINDSDTIENNENERGKEVLNSVSRESASSTKVEDKDVSEIEELDLRDLNDIKEVNVLIKDTRILVK